MPSNDTEKVFLTPPFATVDNFGVHAEDIDYYLTELISDISFAGDSTGDAAIDHAVCIICDCHRLNGYLIAHLDRLMFDKKHLPKSE